MQRTRDLGVKGQVGTENIKVAYQERACVDARLATRAQSATPSRANGPANPWRQWRRSD